MDLEALLDSDIQNRSIPPVLMPEVVDLDDFPDYDLDTGLASFAGGKQAIDTNRTNKPLVCPELKLIGLYCDIPQIMPPRSVLQFPKMGQRKRKRQEATDSRNSATLQMKTSTAPFQGRIYEVGI